ncbi:MAG: hypothetical protein AB7U83_23435 [Vicinamibacterales bacterium]
MYGHLRNPVLSAYEAELCAAPPVRPTPRQAAVVEMALVAVRERRVRLPAQVEIRWCARLGAIRGCATREGDRFAIYLNVAALPHRRALFEVAVHELAHVSDFYTGKARTTSREDLEHRAQAFAARVVQGEAWLGA